MKISVIGSGYVGLVTGACFAKLGNDVVLVDIDAERVAMINRGEAPFYEPGLEEILKEGLAQGKIEAITDTISSVKWADVVFICVQTPNAPDGSVDLTYIRAAAKSVGEGLREREGVGYPVVVVKSSVIPGTTEFVVRPILEDLSGKRAGVDFGVAMNPEFLREGAAVKDFLEPDRIVIGAMEGKARDVLSSLYSGFNCPVLHTNLVTGEMLKYASNAFLATKISFINEIANICGFVPGLDVLEVARGVGLDHRVNPQFLNAGIGFGGSCLPKDLRALVSFVENTGNYEPKLLKSVLEVNDFQPLRLVGLAVRVLGSLSGKRVSVLGLSFKPNTNDMREAPSIKIINRLLELGAEVVAYDPVAKETARRELGDRIIYAETVEECLKGADCCFIVTEWEQFKNLEPGDFKRLMKRPLIFDGRRVFKPENFIAEKVECYSVGLNNFPLLEKYLKNL